MGSIMVVIERFYDVLLRDSGLGTVAKDGLSCVVEK